MRFYKKYADTGDRSLQVIPEQTGRLAIIGGRLEADNSTVFAAMKPLCNGRIAVVPVASDIPEEVGAEAVDSFERNGIHAELLPLFWRRRADAFDPALVERVESCGSVYFTGGDQSRIIGTLSFKAVRKHPCSGPSGRFTPTAGWWRDPAPAPPSCPGG